MCGIVGYLGKNNSKKILLEGLRELEYRGYDSAGITILQNNKFKIFKAVGKLTNLIEKSKNFDINGFSVGIGHTRWATHGKPTENNAHPHQGELTHIVHNGIIENYQELKKTLLKKGYKFSSQTDTEVIVHLFEENLKIAQDTFSAFNKTIFQLKGAYALLLIKRDEPNRIYFAKEGSPLIYGKKNDEVFFSSSDTPLIGKVDEVVYFQDGEFGYIQNNEIKIFAENGDEVEPKYSTLPKDKNLAQKNGFRYFMEKEIYEQSQVISDAIMGRVQDKNIFFDEVEKSFFDGIDEIKKFKEASWVRIYKKATTAFKNDDFDTALKDIKPLENLGLKLDKVYQLESIIYLKKKNDDKAIIYLEKTFEVNNKNKAIANQLAVLYFKKDNFEKAAEYYQKVINLEPNNVDTYFNLAITYGKLENNDKVISTYEKILSIDPKNTDALNYLGYQYFSAKNYNKAIEFFTKYCKINNTDADALRLLTFSYAKNKNFRQAVNTAIEWHKVDPTDTVAVQLIVANANMGKMHKIAKKYSKILKTME